MTPANAGEPRSRVEYLSRDGIGRLRLIRPGSANTIDMAFGNELQLAVQQARDSGDRAVVLESEGSIFCGGGDLKEFADAAEQAGGLGEHIADVAANLHLGLLDLWDLDQPVVASVQGAVAGAGLGLMCCADLVVAADSARFLMAYTRLGLTPDAAASFFLPRLIGLRRATELTLSNRELNAGEALSFGLINAVAPDSAVRREADRVAEQLSRGPAGAFGRAKHLLRDGYRAELATQMQREVQALRTSGNSAEGREGVAAFVTRRQARFV